MFINIATCFDHNFGHHQALNEHSQVLKHIGYPISELYINKVLC
jgi:hypothetical protein